MSAAIPLVVMPRDSTRSLPNKRATRVSIWRSAAIAPRSCDSMAYAHILRIPSYAKTPAEKFICSLLEDCGMELGRGSADVRRNVTLSVWVDVQKVCPCVALLRLSSRTHPL